MRKFQKACTCIYICVKYLN